MPTFENPAADADEVAAAIRGLAHATRAIDDPTEIYSVLGSLSAGLASLEQALHQLGQFHDGPARERAWMSGDAHAGSAASYKEAWELHRAAEMVHQVAARLDRAHEVEATIAYDRATSRRSRTSATSMPTTVCHCERPAGGPTALGSPGLAWPGTPTGSQIAQGGGAVADDRRPRAPTRSGQGQGGGTHGRATSHRRAPPVRRVGPGGVADPGPVPTAPASGHVRDVGRAYPFLAEGGLGSEGVFVGQDLYGGSFRLRPVGAVPAASSPPRTSSSPASSAPASPALAKSLYTRSIPFGRRVYVPGDPKGEHTAVAEAVGGKAIALGHGMTNRLNPLDEGHRPAGLDDAQWAGTGHLPTSGPDRRARGDRP